MRYVLCAGLVVGLFAALAGGPVADGRATQDVAGSTTVETASGLRVTVVRDGAYEITTAEPSWTFGGRLEGQLTSVIESASEDPIGRYREVSFEYAKPKPGRGAIRAYESSPIVLFTAVDVDASEVADVTRFPTLHRYPSLPYRLSYRTEPFSPLQFNSFDQATDSPWVFFDAAANGFVLSAADNFMVARTWQLPDGGITMGVAPEVGRLPDGFTHRTLLVASSGLNGLFETWGGALTSLQGKHRVPNDADLTLEKLGYWSDNGAAYYYRGEPALGYAGTLRAAVADVQRRGVQLGYLQLDSWFYPKGGNARWDNASGGVFLYRADQTLFSDGLLAFQQAVGLPLVAHARWIDPASPYRRTHAISGNVATDPRYWAETMAYLKASGVVTYEQDWLGAHAQPSSTSLTEPEAFMANMAQAAADHGLTLQYCMPLPRHFLQSTRYDGLTSMRVSDDRFERSRWDTFLYGSRLATALGTWPWSDVFFSSETHNLLLSTLSGGVVGIGDRIGAVDIGNLRRAVRADGVIVKPDTGLLPTDGTYVAEAQGPAPAMVATAATDHGELRAVYVVAYARGPNDVRTPSLSIRELGLAGSAYAYEPFTRSGRLIGEGDGIFNQPVRDLVYMVVVPVGPSGVAFLGDLGLFASLGRKRIPELADDGTLRAVVEFADGEHEATLGGYAPQQPSFSSPDSAIDAVAYDPVSGLFSFVVAPLASRRHATVGVTLREDVARLDTRHPFSVVVSADHPVPP
jgi:hypothetical protein